MRDVVWLAWDGQALIGLFAIQADAVRRAEEARREHGVEPVGYPTGWPVRVEPWSVAPPSGAPPFVQGGSEHERMLPLTRKQVTARSSAWPSRTS